MMDMEHGEMSHEKMREWKMKWREMAAVRVLTAVIVVIFVFWCGFEFGEIRASIGEQYGGGYGPSMMRTWGGNVEYSNPSSMMRVYNTQAVPVSGVTSGAAATPSGKQ